MSIGVEVAVGYSHPNVAKSIILKEIKSIAYCSIFPTPVSNLAILRSYNLLILQSGNHTTLQSYNSIVQPGTNTTMTKEIQTSAVLQVWISFNVGEYLFFFLFLVCLCVYVLGDGGAIFQGLILNMCDSNGEFGSGEVSKWCRRIVSSLLASIMT